ncbi:MAG: ABC1 kinase family protein [Thermodesulfobacteriota bacterium]
MDFRTIARFGRFKDIVFILVRYGFDDLVQRLDLPGIGVIKRIEKADRELGTYERIRYALEDMGPTFVKFGQIMSLRPDLLPPSLIRELSRLQDEVAPEAFANIKGVVKESLNRDMDEVFSAFYEKPLASASLAQVHRGVLRETGRSVAIKVQRQGIRRKIELDLDILEAFANRLHERSEDLRMYDLPNLVHIIHRNLLRELDFTREARNMKIARNNMDEEAGIYIPKAYEEFCSEQVLVMEYVEGTKIKDLDHLMPDDAESLASQGLNAAIKQILEDGFFHADPHPGNLLIGDGKRLCLMDWGMVGRLSERDRFELVDLIKAVVEKDSEALVDSLLLITKGEYGIDRRGMERELLEILDTYFSVPIKDMNLGHLLLDITTLLRSYRLRLPTDLVIMIKALITAEGTARQLYPELNVVSEAEESIKRIAAARFRPGKLLHDIRGSIRHFMVLQRQFPLRVFQIIDKLDRGELAIRFEHRNLEGLRKTLEHTFNRLTAGIIIAAMIIGSTMIITTGVGPLLFGFPAMGVIGYLISGLLGLVLVFNIIRGRK